MSGSFGRRLRGYRKLKHWTQLELAAEVGVSVAIIGSLERGTRSPSRDLLHRLTKILGVSEAELAGSDELTPQHGFVSKF